MRLGPKVHKQTQETIRGEMIATLGALLDPVDHKLPGSLRKTIEKTSHRLAQDVLHVLHTSRLDSLIPRDEPESEPETMNTECQ